MSRTRVNLVRVEKPGTGVPCWASIIAAESAGPGRGHRIYWQSELGEPEVVRAEGLRWLDLHSDLECVWVFPVG